jgi:phosphocarrier protein
MSPHEPGQRAEARLEIVNPLGLHMRAAQRLIAAIDKLDAQITICKDDQTVNARSIIGLMMLAAGQGSHIDVVATGADAQAAVDAIAAMLASG